MARTTIGPNIVNHHVAGLGFLRVQPSDALHRKSDAKQLRSARGVLLASVLCAMIWAGIIALAF